MGTDIFKKLVYPKIEIETLYFMLKSFWLVLIKLGAQATAREESSIKSEPLPQL